MRNRPVLVPLRRGFLAVFVLAIAFIGPARADRVDDIVKAEMDRQHIPGVSIAVMKNGKIVRSGGYGLASVELNVPATARTVYKIGSVSKQFIASGIMLLAQEGKLHVGDPVEKFFDDAPATWKGITLREMLSHTAGLTRESPAFHPGKIQPDILLIRAGYAPPLVFAPREKWQYSNLGFFALAEIIQRVSGQPWPEFFEQRFFRPLEMSATRTTSATEIIPGRADGYVWEAGKLTRAPEYQALRPSGAFVSNVEDLAKWDAALGTNSPLTKATRQQMETAVLLSTGASSAYGFGWEVQTRGGKRSVHHGGSMPGFRSHMARFPDDGLSFVVLTNGDNAVANRLLFKIAAEWIPGADAGPANGRPQ